MFVLRKKINQKDLAKNEALRRWNLTYPMERLGMGDYLCTIVKQPTYVTSDRLLTG